MENKLSRFFLGVFFLASVANAGYLRMVPEVTISESESHPGMAVLAGTLENQGDESSVDVNIEFAKTSKIAIALENFETKEKKDFSIEVPETELAVTGFGQFLVPLRINYHDTNRVSFSGPFVITYTKKGNNGSLVRSSPVSLILDERTQKAGAVELANEEEFGIDIANTSGSPIDVAIDFVTSKELQIVSEKNMKLAPQEQKSIKVRVTNRSALKGSNYANFVLISGQIEGQNFSDYLPFQVNITGKESFPIMTWALAVLLVIFIIVGFVYARRDKKRSQEEDQKVANSLAGQ